MRPSFLAQVKKVAPLCFVSTPSPPSLRLSLSLSPGLPWLICRRLTGVIKKGSQGAQWDQETSRCASICWELTAINFSEGLSKAAAAKRSAS